MLHALVINCELEEGVNVEVGSVVLNVFVPDQALLFDCTADNVVIPANWVVKLLLISKYWVFPIFDNATPFK